MALLKNGPHELVFLMANCSHLQFCMTEMFTRWTIAAFAARQFDDSPFVWYAVMREREGRGLSRPRSLIPWAEKRGGQERVLVSNCGIANFQNVSKNSPKCLQKPSKYQNVSKMSPKCLQKLSKTKMSPKSLQLFSKNYPKSVLNPKCI